MFAATSAQLAHFGLKNRSRLSSSSVQCPFFSPGFSTFFHRCKHCTWLRPGIRSAMSFHCRSPSSPTARRSSSSSSADHFFGFFLSFFFLPSHFLPTLPHFAAVGHSVHLGHQSAMSRGFVHRLHWLHCLHWLYGLYGLHGLHGLRRDLDDARLRVLPKQLGLHRDRIARLRLPSLHLSGVDAERIHAEIVRKRRRWLELSDPPSHEITCSVPGKSRQGASLHCKKPFKSKTNRGLRDSPDDRRTRKANTAE